MQNYSPDLERAQLLEAFKVADARYAEANGKSNDARLERARVLADMRATFPITGARRVRAGWREWCEENMGLSYRSVICELSIAREPARIIHSRQLSSTSHTPKRATQVFRKHWPTWTQEQREEAIGLIRKAMGAA